MELECTQLALDKTYKNHKEKWQINRDYECGVFVLTEDKNEINPQRNAIDRGQEDQQQNI